ncbi:unnamed protein product [Phytophthora lilii]|uniref:Unnamed protein product n=1 Tax=Phytophthora lilii TaxID=2077276 RepID=A0A9W6TZK5_9STRA|nr:unnamed protein product [Phytophthora lilii]GMF23010.1 unnamed protein product [Phytophthora lilii]
MGLSFSTSDVNFEKTVPISFANGTTPVLEHHLPKDWPAQLKFVPNSNAGDFQDLIMWEQLPDAAYTALNSNDFYEDFNPPMNDDNFKMLLERAWPSAYWKTK